MNKQEEDRINLIRSLQRKIQIERGKRKKLLDEMSLRLPKTIHRVLLAGTEPDCAALREIEQNLLILSDQLCIARGFAPNYLQTADNQMED